MQQMNENNYRVRKLADDLWTIEDMGVRCFLLHGENGTMLIDACRSGGEAFAGAVRSVIGDTPYHVIVTHADPDHTAGISQRDIPMLHPAEFDRYRSYRPRGEGHDEGLLAVKDGEVIPCGARELKVLLIPGHTPGSIALLDVKNREIFSGDTISTGPVFMFGAGRNLEAYIDSLALLEEISGEFDKFYCAHGDTEVPVSHLAVQKEAAEKLLAGELQGSAPPMEVGKDVKVYQYKGAAFLYPSSDCF